MAPGGRKSNRVTSNPYAEPRPGGKIAKDRLDYLMPGTINANTIRKLGMQDGMASSGLSSRVDTVNANIIPILGTHNETTSSRLSSRVGTINASIIPNLGMQDETTSSGLSGRVNTINANTIQMPVVQDGINISESGGRSIKARLDFGAHDTQGKTASSGPVGKRSNTIANIIRMPATVNTSAGARRSTNNASLFPMPNMNDKTTSSGQGPGGKRSTVDANPIVMLVAQDKNTTSTGARRSTTNASPFPMPHTNDISASFGPGSKRSTTDANNPILMPATNDKNTSAGLGARRSTTNASPLPIPNTNDKIARSGGR